MRFFNSRQPLVAALTTVALGALGALGGCNGMPSPESLMEDGHYESIDPGVRRDESTIKTDALIYDGAGAANAAASTLADIVAGEGMTYDIVSSDEMNELTLEDLKSYGVIIWPGGLATTMSSSLTAETRRRIRSAVRDHGVSYIGFCAGAFIAGTFSGHSPEWGLQIIPADFPYPNFFYDGQETDMLEVDLADGSERDLIYIGGPDLSAFGNSIAQYPDGSSAISQGWAGLGMVIISGPHPEAPDSWKYGFDDPDGSDHDFAAELIHAALDQKELEAKEGPLSLSGKLPPILGKADHMTVAPPL